MTFDLRNPDTQLLLNALKLYLHTEELREAYAVRDGDRESAREAAHSAHRLERMIEEIIYKESK